MIATTGSAFLKYPNNPPPFGATTGVGFSGTAITFGFGILGVRSCIGVKDSEMVEIGRIALIVVPSPCVSNIGNAEGGGLESASGDGAFIEIAA